MSESSKINFDKFIILDEGDITFPKPINQTSATGSVAHGFDGPVMVMAFIASGINSLPLPLIEIDNTTGIINVLRDIRVDETHIHVTAYTPQDGTNYGVSFTVNVHYFVIDKETATS